MGQTRSPYFTLNKNPEVDPEVPRLVQETTNIIKKADLSILPSHHSCHFTLPECPHSHRMAAIAPAPPPRTMSKAGKGGASLFLEEENLPLKSSSRFPVSPLCLAKLAYGPTSRTSLAKSLNGWVERCWELTFLEHPPPDNLKRIQDLDCKEERKVAVAYVIEIFACNLVSGKVH